MNTGEGLHRFVDPVDGGVYLYTQFETADAKRMFACFDQPDLKATLTVTVTAPADWEVISNGAAEAVTDADHGAKRHAFATTALISTYLVALIAGPVRAVARHLRRRARRASRSASTAARASPSTWTPSGCSPRPSRASTSTTATSACRYPFGKYDQLFVPEFNAGAMENAGAVTFLEDYVFRSRVTRYLYERRAETVLHEMAHMWFGDLVTMRWWDDLWLNESFATWAERPLPGRGHRVPQRVDDVRQRREGWAYRQDQLPSTHPVAADIPDLQAVEVNFDGITYAKGASRCSSSWSAYVGLEAFLAGLRLYFSRHAWGNATFDDLLGALDRGLRPRPVGLGRAVAAHHRAQHAARRRSRSTTTARYTALRRSCRAAPGPAPGELRTHRLAVGIYGDDGDRASSSAATASSSTSPASAPRCPSWSASTAGDARAGQRRRPHLLHDAARRSAR